MSDMHAAWLPKDPKRRHALGIMMMLSMEDQQAGHYKAMGVPMGMLRAIGLIKGPDERLAAAQDVAACVKLVEEVAEEQAKDEGHDPSCTGECGPLWFFSKILEQLEGLLLSDEAAVDAFLRDVQQGGPHA